MIRSKKYDDCILELINNEEVQKMALEIKQVPLESLRHENGQARFEFMMGANAEFSRRNAEEPKTARHIGAVAEALLTLLTCGGMK